MRSQIIFSYFLKLSSFRWFLFPKPLETSSSQGHISPRARGRACPRGRLCSLVPFHGDGLNARLRPQEGEEWEPGRQETDTRTPVGDPAPRGASEAPALCPRARKVRGAALCWPRVQTSQSKPPTSTPGCGKRITMTPSELGPNAAGTREEPSGLALQVGERGHSGRGREMRTV